jgi:hypothetical protein
VGRATRGPRRDARAEEGDVSGPHSRLARPRASPRLFCGIYFEKQESSALILCDFHPVQEVNGSRYMYC